MTTFVLVHGGWHGAWCWQRVATRLRALGHDVLTPTLSGHGERENRRSAEINISTHVTDIVNVLRFEDLSDVVLVGHSYGGNIITGVADVEPGRLRRLIYLDGHVPENGQSCWDLAPDFREFFIESASNNGGIWVSPVPAEGFNVNLADREMVDRLCVPMTLAMLVERSTLTGAGKSVPSTFVLATDWTPNPFVQFYDKYRDDPNWTVRTIDTGHDVMLDDPYAVVDLLTES